MSRMIKLLFMDVDGTLTDGRIYMGPDGEVMKAFDIKDGYGIHEILPAHGIVPVIITGRTSETVRRRADELGITELHQGRHEKMETMIDVLEKYHCPADEAAYIGDDVLDLPCMEICGIAGCPADAAEEVRNTVAFVSSKPGGKGAVREFIEWLVSGDDWRGRHSRQEVPENRREEE